MPWTVHFEHCAAAIFVHSPQREESLFHSLAAKRRHPFPKHALHARIKPPALSEVACDLPFLSSHRLSLECPAPLERLRAKNPNTSAGSVSWWPGMMVLSSRLPNKTAHSVVCSSR